MLFEDVFSFLEVWLVMMCTILFLLLPSFAIRDETDDEEKEGRDCHEASDQRDQVRRT